MSSKPSALSPKPSALSPKPFRVTVLGSGTSTGVPAIGCDCAVCRSADPRDRRLRPSIVIEVDGGPSILVDTSTDLREQALTHRIRRVDAIFFTHSHADHVMGLDDVRRYNQMQRAPIPCYGDAETLANIRRMFGYVFEPPQQIGGGIPQLTLVPIDGPFAIAGTSIIPIRVYHGTLPILGFRIGSFAYLTDCNRIPDESYARLEGVRTLVIDALRHRPHSTHFSVAEAIDVAARIGAERTYFTHICHEISHAETSGQLPAGVELAYDGLVIEVNA